MYQYITASVSVAKHVSIMHSIYQ